MDYSVSTSASTIRSLHHTPVEQPVSPHPAAGTNVSLPSSPRSSALPSPPDSPSSDSVSSFPSVSSSFFFSSAAASSPHSQPHSDQVQVRDSTQGLIIPSLTLPDALRRPTPYGQTLGDMRLLVLGSKGTGKSFMAGLLLEDNEDVVEVATWEECQYGRVLRASTNWVEDRDDHGLEKFEPARNVEIIELPGYDQNDDPHVLVETLKYIIQNPFYAILDVLDPKCQPSAVVATLVSSPSTPLYTALLLLLPSSPSPLEHLLVENLGAQIPTIVLSRLSNHHRSSLSPKLSSFRPSSATALRIGLFRSPETLATLRNEAADHFLRWREIERVVDDIHTSRREEIVRAQKNWGSENLDGVVWNKAKWESEWEASLSHDVAKRLREGTVTERTSDRSVSGHNRDHDQRVSCISFDPLHLPSLFMFSLSLLGPLQHRLGRSIAAFVEALGDHHVKLALVGGFCVGIGIGLFLR